MKMKWMESGCAKINEVWVNLAMPNRTSPLQIESAICNYGWSDWPRAASQGGGPAPQLFHIGIPEAEIRMRAVVPRVLWAARRKAVLRKHDTAVFRTKIVQYMLMGFTRPASGFGRGWEPGLEEGYETAVACGRLRTSEILRHHLGARQCVLLWSVDMFKLSRSFLFIACSINLGLLQHRFIWMKYIV